MKKGIDKFSKRLDDIFDQGLPTKTQIIDAYNKFAQQPSSMGDYKCHVETNVKDSKGNPVFVDKCLKEAIELLNKQGIKTLASCCGHGKISPTILIGQQQPSADLKQYMTNLLYYARTEVIHMTGKEFEQWAEEQIEEIDSYFKETEAIDTGSDFLIEQLKKDFSGSSDYLSGVNDGMYHHFRNLQHMEKLSEKVFDKLGIEQPQPEQKPTDEEIEEWSKDKFEKFGIASTAAAMTTAKVMRDNPEQFKQLTK